MRVAGEQGAVRRWAPGRVAGCRPPGTGPLPSRPWPRAPRPSRRSTRAGRRGSPDGTEEPTARALRAAAETLLGRSAGAEALLASFAGLEDAELRLWRALAAAGMGEPSRAWAELQRSARRRSIATRRRCACGSAPGLCVSRWPPTRSTQHRRSWPVSERTALTHIRKRRARPAGGGGANEPDAGHRSGGPAGPCDRDRQLADRDRGRLHPDDGPRAGGADHGRGRAGRARGPAALLAGASGRERDAGAPRRPRAAARAARRRRQLPWARSSIAAPPSVAGERASPRPRSCSWISRAPAGATRRRRLPHSLSGGGIRTLLSGAARDQALRDLADGLAGSWARRCGEEPCRGGICAGRTGAMSGTAGQRRVGVGALRRPEPPYRLAGPASSPPRRQPARTRSGRGSRCRRG